MKQNIKNHPCFNDEVRHLYGRIHLPVAPRCNMQCNFCNRQFDCVNESRPGVTSSLLNPLEALCYLKVAMEKKSKISVVGIAGPGDPFANPEDTLETLRLIHEEYPEMLLCVATNGLNLLPYIDDLAKMGVSHVTITINAVDPVIASSIYSWIRYKKRVMSGIKAMELLLDNQLAAIGELKKHGILVKVNSIIIPGINDHHIPEIAEVLSSVGADIINAIPLYKNEKSNFSHIDEPDKELVSRVRLEVGKHLPQMHHCTRCRADAVGLLGESEDLEMRKAMADIKNGVNASVNTIPAKSLVAVATMEGLLVNQHLGEAHELSIFVWEDDGPLFKEKRILPEPGSGNQRWNELADILHDCSTLLVSGIGNSPQAALEKRGVNVLVIEGIIEAALRGLFTGSGTDHMVKRTRTSCGQSCSGSAGGCG